jgi:hypothetical protein
MLGLSIETKAIERALPTDRALCIDAIEQAILAGFPHNTQLLRWAIVDKGESTAVATSYHIEATLQCDSL